MTIESTEIETKLMLGLEERALEARIVSAMAILGYPTPAEGMNMLRAMKLIADALEDLALKKVVYPPLSGDGDND